MANRQTRQFKKKNWSLKVNKGAVVKNSNREQDHYTIFEYPAGIQPSKRRTPWGLKLPKPDREIVYPAEFKNRAKSK